MSFSEASFDVERVWSAAHVSEEMLQNSSLEREELLSGVGASVMLRATARVACYDLEHNEVSYPADWWEAFKERWFPAWALERWPVRNTTKRITIKALYPDLPVDVDSRQFIQAFQSDVSEEW